MPKARFVSSRKPSTSRYTSPNAAAPARNRENRSHRILHPFTPAGRTIPRLLPAGARFQPATRAGFLFPPWTAQVQRSPGHPDRGGVNHLPVHAYRAGARSVRRLVRPDHFFRPGDLAFRRGENLVDDGHLRRVDAPFAVEAEGPRETAGGPQALLVTVVGHGAVHGPESRGPRRHHHALHDVPEAVAGIRLVPLVPRPEARLRHPEARGEIPRPEVQGAEAVRRAGDGVDVRQALCGLYLGFERYLAGRKLPVELYPVEQDGDGVEVLGAVDLGDQDGVKPLARRLGDLDHVPVEPARVEGVDPEQLGPAAPVQLVQGSHHVVPGARLLLRGHGILEVEKDGVGLGGERLLHHLPVRRRDRQQRPRRAHLPDLPLSRNRGPFSHAVGLRALDRTLATYFYRTCWRREIIHGRGGAIGPLPEAGPGLPVRARRPDPDPLALQRRARQRNRLRGLGPRTRYVGGGRSPVRHEAIQLHHELSRPERGSARRAGLLVRGWVGLRLQGLGAEPPVGRRLRPLARFRAAPDRGLLRAVLRPPHAGAGALLKAPLRRAAGPKGALAGDAGDGDPLGRHGRGQLFSERLDRHRRFRDARVQHAGGGVERHRPLRHLHPRGPRPDGRRRPRPEGRLRPAARRPDASGFLGAHGA